MRSIVSLAALLGLVLLNFLAIGVGRANGAFIKVPAPPPPFVVVKYPYGVFIQGATPGTLPADTVGYEFDLLFDTQILSLTSATDHLVGVDTIDISPLPADGGLRLLAMGSQAVPDDLISTLEFLAEQIGSTEIAIDAFAYFAPSGPGGEIVAWLQPPDEGFITVTVVPEPSSVMLVGIGFALLASTRRQHF